MNIESFLLSDLFVYLLLGGIFFITVRIVFRGKIEQKTTEDEK